MHIVVDNYGPDKSINAEEVAKSFSSVNGINVELRDYYSENMYCSGWVDYGINVHSRKKGIEEAKSMFNSCMFPKTSGICMSLINGIIYPCFISPWVIELGLEKADPNEIIDLFDESQTDDEIREKIAALYSRDYLSACAYCNGLCEDSVRYAPAEQLPR